MKRLIFISIALSILCSKNGLSQQTGYDFFSDTMANNLEANTVPYFYTDYLAYFKNNEYPTGIVDGYTLLGNKLETQIIFRPNAKYSFVFGAIYNKFFWTDSTFFQPLMRIQGNFGNFRVIMGNIYPAANHQHLTQIYDFEKIMTHPAEHGIQLLYSDNRWRLETWLDWWRFIFYGSKHPENFNVGGNYSLMLLKTSHHKLTLNYQTVFAHTGGEIDSSDAYTLTINNQAAGATYSYKTHKFGLASSVYYLVYGDLTKTETYPYQSGNAWLAEIKLQYDNFTLYGGYWSAYHYIAPNGEMYFTNYNIYNGAYETGKRLFMLNSDYTVKINNFALKTGLFIHFTQPRINYGYYLYMQFTMLGKLKQN